MDLPTAPTRRGKINGACYFLLQQFGSGRSIVGYRDVLEDFIAEGRDVFGNIAIAKRLELSDIVGISGLGLHLVYALRNQFAHGALSFPMPSGAEPENARSAAMATDSASRLVLLSLQMLVGAFLDRATKSDGVFQKVLESDEEFQREIKRVRIRLETLQFCQENAEQLPLFTSSDEDE